LNVSRHLFVLLHHLPGKLLLVVEISAHVGYLAVPEIEFVLLLRVRLAAQGDLVLKLINSITSVLQSALHRIQFFTEGFPVCVVSGLDLLGFLGHLVNRHLLLMEFVFFLLHRILLFELVLKLQTL